MEPAVTIEMDDRLEQLESRLTQMQEKIDRFELEQQRDGFFYPGPYKAGQRRARPYVAPVQH